MAARRGSPVAQRRSPRAGVRQYVISAALTQHCHSLLLLLQRQQHVPSSTNLHNEDHSLMDAGSKSGVGSSTQLSWFVAQVGTQQLALQQAVQTHR